MMIKYAVTLSRISVVENVFFQTRRYSSTSKRSLSKDQYNVKRGNFKALEPQHIQFFRDLLGETRILTGVNNLDKYNEDWYGFAKGESSLVVKPKTTDEVSAILSYCNKNLLAVCPQGGNTSVVASGVPVFDEVILSMELMNKIHKIDDVSGVVIFDAGCVLENLNNAVSEKGLIVPLDLGAKGNCQLGGNLSTNAGGLRLIRYGNLHGNVLGVEAVKADGEIINCLRTFKKDNTGYHLKHLFIGSEGTLGVITKIALQCPPHPKSKNIAFLGLESYDKVLKTFKKAKFDLGETLSAVEVLDRESVILTEEKLALRSPIGEYPFYLIIETSGSNEQYDSEKMDKFLEISLKENLILNGVASSEPSKIKNIWEIRERTAEALRHDGYVFCYDFSVPLQHFYTLVDLMKTHMGSKSHRVFGFGHLGDSNLHLQVSVREHTKEIQNMIEPFVFEKVREINGSISSEHGMGFLKAKYLDISNHQSATKLMRVLKNVMDPNGILNPYKVIPY
ncbi:D-2-hydroxyglutarate dehydrogenase, mitochondrial-like [Agrilus planipennis]|uniref:D-2-hydroxyglutarate dehydrogenase, mitochondrial n=1 Tax=Agrilus planipennis TaxID=224129 RepID=A0A1W4WY92_AGRPL|nr:D-2-hydroxyglutarate dehydrogenase, mitochondrial-like [Agrilus planipennis]